MKYVIFLILPLIAQANNCWRKCLVKESTQVYTINVLSPTMETESEKMTIFLPCKQADKLNAKDEIELDEKTIKYNKLDDAGMMMKKTYKIIEKL